MGGVSNTLKKAVSNPLRTLANVGTFGTYELARKGLPGLTRPFETIAQKLTGQTPQGPGPGSAVEGDFNLDLGQLGADQADIAALGASQDAQNQKFITEDASSRESNRQRLAQALQTQANESFQRMLPETEEKLNSQHLLDGSGLGQELARQQGYLSKDIANQIGTQGALDLDRTSDQRAAALKALQGYGSAGLSRQFSLEDLVTNANIAKRIGSQAAPQVQNGKGIGSGLAGAGLGAKIGGTFGPMGGIAGAGIGGLLSGFGK